jgi:uncharacterized protein
MRIVLDTTVVVSAMLNPNGTPGAILRGVLGGRFRLLVDNRIVFEYSDVLSRPKFRLDPNDIHAFLDFVEHEAEYVTAPPIDTRFDDPDDRPFYEVALSGEADYLITGNCKHFPENPVVCNPGHFLRVSSAHE